MAAYSLVVTSAGVQVLGSSGTLTTLSFPSGVVAVPGARARIAILGGRIVITGSVSVPIWLSSDLVLRVLRMPTPSSAPTLAAGAAGGYTGTRRARVSYILRDPLTGAILAEGPLGPISAAVTVAAKLIDLSAIPVPNSNDPVTGRRIYLTTDGGSEYFAAVDIADITSTTASDDTPDAGLSLVAADENLVASPSDLTLITEWKNRLWGKTQTDIVAGSSSGRVDRWPNEFEVGPVGSDSKGITGFIPRRDEMAIGRRNLLWKLTGRDDETFALVKLEEGKGILAPDSCLVIRDVGYFLSEDGVYTWDAEGVRSISDETVRPWFTTDTYFARGQFANAFAGYDPVRHQYVLFLAPAGSSSITRWVTFDILTRKWFGPHKSGLSVVWTAAAVAPDANDVLRLIVAADDGFLYAFDPASFTDGTSTAVDFDVTTKAFSGNPPEPDLEHAWLMPTVFTKADSAGTLTITPTLGDLGSAAGTDVTHDLTVERERLPRLGSGRLCQLRLRQNTAGRGLELYGLKLPYITLGRR